MRKIFPVILTALLLAMPGLGQNGGSAEPAAEFEPVVKGRVSWKGKVFKPREVLWPVGTREKNIALEKMILGKTILDQSLLVDPETRGIANCVTVVTGVELGVKQPTIVPVEIKDLAFNERVLVMRPGGRVRLRNFDSLRYRFLILADGAVIREFELGPSSQLDLDLPMKEKIVLMERTFPFLSTTVCQPAWAPVMITDKDGRFEVQGLRPGPVKLAFWHEVLGAVVKTVEVQPKVPTELELTQDDFDNATAKLGSLEDLEGKKDPVLKINGLAVGRKVFDEILKYVRTRYDDFTLPDSTLKRYAIKSVFIPLVTSLAHHRGQQEMLKDTQAVIDAALAEGKSLKDAAVLAKADFSGTDGPWVGRRDLEPWLGSRIFNAPKNLVIGPVATATGMNYFLVTATSGRGVKEKRRFQHVFLSFRPQLTLTQLNALIRELGRRARVEAVEKALEGAIPPRNKE